MLEAAESNVNPGDSFLTGFALGVELALTHRVEARSVLDEMSERAVEYEGFTMEEIVRWRKEQVECIVTGRVSIRDGEDSDDN